MLIPRYYQIEAKQALYDYWRGKPDGAAILSLCTGSGKSLLIADISKDVIQKKDNTRIIILSHVSEILQQNASQLLRLWPKSPVGVYSASLRSKQVGSRIVVAGIQSVHKKANVMGWFSLVIVDECHLLSDKDQGMYRNFINDLRRINPNIKILGLSATPWRTKGGLLTEGETPLFDDIVYTYSMRQAIDDGFLCPLISKYSVSQADLSNVSTLAGEFNLGEMAEAFDNEILTQAAIKEIIHYGQDRKAWLLFGSSVKHAMHLCSTLLANNVETACITGETPTLERDGILRMFKCGEKYRAITNNNVLTTGTDIPRIDLIAMLRATKSSGLLLQAVGRGVRLSPETNKEQCLFLDYGGNLERFGCIDQIEAPSQRKKRDKAEMPMKVCPTCRSVHAISVRECGDCGYIFPIDTTYKHEEKATNAPAMTKELGEWFDIDDVLYAKHPGKVERITHDVWNVEEIKKPDTLKVTYVSGARIFREWVCMNHTGFAKKKALVFLEGRLIFLEDTSIEERFTTINDLKIDDIINSPELLQKPTKIRIRRNGKFEEIVGYEF